MYRVNDWLLVVKHHFLNSAPDSIEKGIMCGWSVVEKAGLEVNSNHTLEKLHAETNNTEKH